MFCCVLLVYYHVLHNILCFDMLHHLYADGTQLNIEIKKQDCFANKLFDIEHCMPEIK